MSYKSVSVLVFSEKLEKKALFNGVNIILNLTKDSKLNKKTKKLKM